MTTACTRLPMTQPAQLRAARRWLHEHDDELATAPTAVSTGAPDALLARSWQRSRHAGLTPCGRTPGAPHASGAQLARALQRQHELVSHARPVMEFMFPHVGQTASLVILADADGMLLHTLGDTDFTGRAERVALRPGACWLERWRGTNAIGTALAEAMPMVVHGGEHYLQRNGFLTCAAERARPSVCGW
jgi:sigma-54 dependent transcriptional regulator, acetoin dehydrogenase operon transcriptional activator AcoR